MERAFGCSFAQVRLHEDEGAARSARSLHAEAWNFGVHIVFAKDRFDPGSREGLVLLAHELAHVVQQRGAATRRHSATQRVSEDKLEAEAQSAAERIASGGSAGVLSDHAPSDTVRRFPCPGPPIWQHVSAKPKEIWLPANSAIEVAYKLLKPGNSILFGSDFLRNAPRSSSPLDIRLPSGVPNKAFGNRLLEELRGLSNQLEPDIIDFTERTFYEIKTEEIAKEYSAKVKSQLLHYYKLTETIRIKYGAALEPEWTISNATWKPPVLLPFPGDIKKVVCTAATDYTKWPSGLVLYEVLKKDDDAEKALKQLADARDKLFSDYELNSEDHKKQLALYSQGIAGFWTNRLFNKTPPPDTVIWNNAYARLLRTESLIAEENIPKATAMLAIARAYYLWAFQKYMAWKAQIEGAGAKMEAAIRKTALALIFASVALFVAANPGTIAAGASQLARVGALCDRAIQLLGVAGSDAQALGLIQQAETAAATLP